MLSGIATSDHDGVCSDSDTVSDIHSYNSAPSFDGPNTNDSRATLGTETSSVDELDPLSLEIGPSSRCRRYADTQYFLVSRPVASPFLLEGGSARGYWAVKLPDMRIGEVDYQISFLKDTWRMTGTVSRNEGETMVELVEAGVPYVSDIFCHGDILQGDASGSSASALACKDFPDYRFVASR